MPAFCTHYFFCEEMLDIIGDNTDFVLDKKACAIGAQGPDIFFFGRLLPIAMPGKPLAGYANALHKSSPAELFEAFAEYYKASDNKDIAKSYIYGFVMHYALDRKCHPFVYSLQDKLYAENEKLHHGSIHNTIEHAMDTYMLHIKKNVSPSDFDCAETITANASVVDEIARLLSFVIPRTTGRGISEDDCANAINDTVKFQKYLRDRSGRLTSSVRAIESVLSPVLRNYKISAHINPKDLEITKKYGNINNELWYSPYQPDIPRYESFVDLYNDARGECSSLISGFEDLLVGKQTGYDVTANISFLTGVEL